MSSARRGCAVAGIVGLLVMGGVGFALFQFFWDASPDLSRFRARIWTTEHPCGSADLEIDFRDNSADLRRWASVGSGLCKAQGQKLQLTAEQAAYGARAARRMTSGLPLRPLVSGTRFSGKVQLTYGEGQQVDLDGIRPEGTASFERLYASLLAAAPAAPARPSTPPKSSGGIPIRASSAAGADVADVIVAIEPDAQRALPGSVPQSVNGPMRRGGFVAPELGLVYVGFATTDAALSYSLDGLTAHALGPPRPEKRNTRGSAPTSRCRTTDLWRKAVAAGFPDVDGTFSYINSSLQEGAYWWLKVAEPFRTMKFDGQTCQRVDG